MREWLEAGSKELEEDFGTQVKPHFDTKTSIIVQGGRFEEPPRKKFNDYNLFERSPWEKDTIEFEHEFEFASRHDMQSNTVNPKFDIFF